MRVQQGINSDVNGGENISMIFVQGEEGNSDADVPTTRRARSSNNNSRYYGPRSRGGGGGVSSYYTSDAANNNNSNQWSGTLSDPIMLGNLTIKLLFAICVVLQVVIWPSVMSITFITALGLESIVTYMLTYCTSPDKENTSGGGRSWWPDTALGFSVLPLHSSKNPNTSQRLYICIAAIGAYLLTFFVLFATHEMQLQPAQTTWIAPSALGTYSFNRETNKNNAIGGDVTGSVSHSMRANPFIWPRSMQARAVRVNGTIAGAGPNAGPLVCDSVERTVGGVDCYATRHAAFTPPFAGLPGFVPMSGLFYTADVIVTPPAGVACSALQVYRLILDDAKNVIWGLDYPASIASSAETATARCNLFGMSATWCLQFKHAFTDATYATKVAEKCTLSGNDKLVLRLPERVEDISPHTGRTTMDIIVATKGATVEMRWKWHDPMGRAPLLGPWEQWHTAKDDNAQTWRESSDDVSVFFKYVIVTTPLFITWYYLAVTFKDIVSNYHVLMMCLFVLLPSALIFLSIGAWLPMVGALICTIAITHMTQQYQQLWVRNFSFFLTAVCNSIQLVWILVLVGQADWSAFLYDHTLTQLRELTNYAILIDGTPSWMGLILPTAITINGAFLIGTAICVAFELIMARAPTPSSQQA